MSSKLPNKDHYGDRFLVSFSGKYLAYNYYPESSPSQIEGDTATNLDHQLYKIHVPQTEANRFGPAFIEVNFLSYFLLPSLWCIFLSDHISRLQRS